MWLESHCPPPPSLSFPTYASVTPAGRVVNTADAAARAENTTARCFAGLHRAWRAAGRDAGGYERHYGGAVYGAKVRPEHGAGEAQQRRDAVRVDGGAAYGDHWIW